MKARIFVCFMALVLVGVVALPVSAQFVDTAWARIYISPKGSDYARDIAVDASGNVYVTGWVNYYHIDTTYLNYATIKYDPYGNQLWAKIYDGPAHRNDQANAIAVDNSGNVYVNGYSAQSIDLVNPNYDYATIKYYSNGATAWVKRYNGPGDGNDYARDIAVDNSGNIYVTGDSKGDTTAEDYLTIKYYSNGDTAWVRRYDGGRALGDVAGAMAIDNLGNVYVTGRAYYMGDLNSSMTTIKYYPNGDTAWIRGGYCGGSGDIAVDDSGNVYATGRSGLPFSWCTEKRDPYGNQVWGKWYDGPAHYDEPYALAADNLGNVHVTGCSRRYCWGNDQPNDLTIKHYSNGDTAWVRRYAHPCDYSYLKDIAVDNSGNVYVTGESKGQYLTVKYYSNGDVAWATEYGELQNAPDEASAMAIDESGNVYVTGSSDQDFTTYTYCDYLTIKYIQTTEAEITLPIDTTGADIAFAVLDDTLAVFNFSEEALDSITVMAYLDTLPPNTAPDGLWVHQLYSITAYPETANYEATMILSYHQIEFDSSGLPNKQELELYRFDDSAWTLQGGEANPATNSITLTGVTKFSLWAISDPEFIGTSQEQTPRGIPGSFALSQNYPNPFNPITEIKYALPRDCWVKLEVYNILGQKVARLVDRNQKAGYKAVRWDASPFSSGIYFYRLKAGDFVQTRKMLLLK